MKQTAVEWLVEKFNQCEPMYSGIQSLEHKHYLDNLIDQAKAMEKEQIIQAITKTIIGSNVIYDNEYPEVIYTAEQYYNETYESNT